ncbi:MAG: Gfo/Idh/MocA family oxidoreductase [Armatimonadetes bacterium]|nr:Gfo/Idh/MocA family oxidoreductase [Armatimonadota bacterium]
MPEKLGCAIWGAGWVSGEHLKAYVKNADCEVVAVGSRRESSARNVAAAAGLDPDTISVYTEYDQLMADDRVQLVSICTPNHLHVAEGVKAAAAGKHMIMEKPMAMSVDGIRELRDAVRESGVKSLVSFVLHWNPGLVNAKALVEAGAIGDVFYAEADYWHGVSDWYAGWEWARKIETGGSSFLFGGCHAVDAIRWLTGLEIVEVAGYAGGWDERYEYPATVVAAVKWSNGAVGKISSSVDCVMPYQFNIDIMGKDGSIRGNRVWSKKLLPAASGWTEVPGVQPDSGDVEHHPFEGEIDHMVNAILKDTRPCPDIEDAVKTHEVCIAVDTSAANGGEPVKLPLV